ncbi:hypothetical protein DFH06DRAFT_1480338 [Mycena polygramma]|nr:hypothetical protein DFH06DRAFT_1480338 [Mycena polygramma]
MHILPSYPYFPPLAGSLSPALLTQICRRWREVALGIPKLWSVISSRDNYTAHGEAHMFQLWLERSRCSPLHLRLGTHRNRPHDQVVEAVIPHHARWEYLEIDRYADERQIFAGPMPLLRHLQLYRVVESLWDTVSLDAPLLRTVGLNDVAASRVILPWAQLTSLTLSSVYPSECVPILMQTLKLVHCDLGVFFDPHEDNEPRRDIPLPCLESLVLTDPGNQPVTDLLHAFVVPALRSLEVPERFLAGNPIETLQAFISKSGCEPEQLHLTGEITVRESSYREAFPLLRKLSLETADEENSTDSDSDSSDT